MKFRPETLVHRVLIKPKIETETKTGIILARDERSQAINSDTGTIFMIGPMAWKDFKCETPPVKVGDQVFYAKYGAKVLKDERTGDLYVICNDDDVLVGFEEESISDD